VFAANNTLAKEHPGGQAGFDITVGTRMGSMRDQTKGKQDYQAFRNQFESK